MVLRRASEWREADSANWCQFASSPRGERRDMAEFILSLLPTDDIGLQLKCATTVADLAERADNHADLTSGEAMESIMTLLDSDSMEVQTATVRALKHLLEEASEKASVAIRQNGGIDALLRVASVANADAHLVALVADSLALLSRDAAVCVHILDADATARVLRLLPAPGRHNGTSLALLKTMTNVAQCGNVALQTVGGDDIRRLVELRRSDPSPDVVTLAKALEGKLAVDAASGKKSETREEKRALAKVLEQLKPGASAESRAAAIAAVDDMDITFTTARRVLKRGVMQGIVAAMGAMLVERAFPMDAEHVATMRRAVRIFDRVVVAIQYDAALTVKLVADGNLTPICSMLDRKRCNDELLIDLTKCLLTLARRDETCCLYIGREPRMVERLLDLLASNESKVSVAAAATLASLSRLDELRDAFQDARALAAFLSYVRQSDRLIYTAHVDMFAHCLHSLGNLAFDAANALLLTERYLDEFRRLKNETDSAVISREAARILAILGVAPPCDEQKRRGLRILAIDGGGVRGIVTIEILRAIEARTGEPIWKTFDVICGTSTGGILASLIGIRRISLDEARRLYLSLCTRVFSSSGVIGTTLRTVAGAKYKAEYLEEVLRANTDDKDMIDHFSADPKWPKRVFFVASLVTHLPAVPFLFRTYQYPQGKPSRYSGTCRFKQWQALRASAAAPSYFEPYEHGDKVFQDGGLCANNPAALALHEARHLFPGCAVRCLLSVGTGAPPSITVSSSGNWVSAVANTIIYSATNVNVVDEALEDALGNTGTYFRLNPKGEAFNFGLDEIRPDILEGMSARAREYVKDKQWLIDKVVAALTDDGDVAPAEEKGKRGKEKAAKAEPKDVAGDAEENAVAGTAEGKVDAGASAEEKVDAGASAEGKVDAGASAEEKADVVAKEKAGLNPFDEDADDAQDAPAPVVAEDAEDAEDAPAPAETAPSTLNPFDNDAVKDVIEEEIEEGTLPPPAPGNPFDDEPESPPRERSQSSTVSAETPSSPLGDLAHRRSMSDPDPATTAADPVASEAPPSPSMGSKKSSGWGRRALGAMLPTFMLGKKKGGAAGEQGSSEGVPASPSSARSAPAPAPGPDTAPMQSISEADALKELEEAYELEIEHRRQLQLQLEHERREHELHIRALVEKLAVVSSPVAPPPPQSPTPGRGRRHSAASSTSSSDDDAPRQDDEEASASNDFFEQLKHANLL